MQKKYELWKKYIAKKQNEEKAREIAENYKNIKAFIDTETKIKYNKKEDDSSDNKIYDKKVFQSEKAALRSKNFWIVDNVPTSKSKIIEEPKKNLVCPITREPIKLKDLIEIHPECTDDNTETTLWMCSISKKPIVHQKAAVIKSTGQLALMNCIEKFALGKDSYFEKEVKKEDIIPLIPGGTGFSNHNKVEAVIFRPVFE